MCAVEAEPASERAVWFEYDRERAKDVVAYMLQEMGGECDLLKLLLMVYFLDVNHFCEYGRPVIGGTYYAEAEGPINRELREDIINGRLDGVVTEEQT